MIYKTITFNFKHLKTNNTFEGISIERDIERMFKTGIQMENTSPLIYTERKDGVLPEFDIRAQKFDIAQKAMQKAAESWRAQRQERINSINNKEG